MPRPLICDWPSIHGRRDLNVNDWSFIQLKFRTKNAVTH